MGIHLRLVCVLFCTLFLGFMISNANAQQYPNKAIQTIVPYEPGGGTDLLARAIGQKFLENTGQPLVILNRPGAGTMIGAEAAAKSKPDGYTILFVTNATIATNQSIYANMRYDPVKDFVTVTLLGLGPNILVVHPSLQVNSVKDLIAMAKSMPGKLNYGSSGEGSTGHLAMEFLKSMSGIDMVHVPYKGGGPSLIALLGGEVKMMFTNILAALPHIKSGKFRALGVSTSWRLSAIPDVPTVAESGLPGFEAVGWFGVVVPTGTPKDIVNKLSAEIVKIVRTPEMKERLHSQGLEPVGNTPEQFDEFNKAEIVKWAKVIKEAGIRPR